MAKKKTSGKKATKQAKRGAKAVKASLTTAVALTPDSIQDVPAARKAQLISIGAQYGSTDTLAQADATLNALAKYGAVLAGYGFIPKDGTRLGAARDGLVAAGVERETVITTGKTTTAAFLQAMTDAKNARRTARAVLENVKRELTDQAGGAAAITRIDKILASTMASGADTKVLGAQLDRLLDGLSNTTVAAEAAERGGPKAVASLQDASTKLRGTKVAKTKPHGTPKETQLLDFFDGVIVVMVRSARKAARAAGDATGDAALAKAFALAQLYRVTGRHKKEGDGTDGGGGGGGGDVTTTAAKKKT